FLALGNKKVKQPEELLLHTIYKMVYTYQEPFDELDKKIGDVEKTIFLKDYSKVSVENLYFLKAQARITKKLLQFFQNVINQMEVKPQQKTALDRKSVV